MTNSGAKPHKAKKNKKKNRSLWLHSILWSRFPFEFLSSELFPFSAPLSSRFKMQLEPPNNILCFSPSRAAFYGLGCTQQDLFFLFFVKALKCSKLSCFDGTSKQNERPFDKMCPSRTFSCFAVLYVVFCTLGCPVKYEHQSHIFLIQGFTMRVRDAPYGVQMWPQYEQIATFCFAKIQS